MVFEPIHGKMKQFMDKHLYRDGHKDGRAGRPGGRGTSLATGLAVSAAAAGLLWLGVGRLVAEPGVAEQAGPSDPESLQFFEEHVRPILADRCVRCHGGEKVAGGLNLANRSLLMEGGDTGPAIDWQALDKSLLLRAISYTDIDYEMPPTGKMPAAEIETLRQWVMMGLPWTGGEAGNLVDPSGEGGEGHHGPLSIEEGRELWQYNPVQKPDVPSVDDAGWSANPVDAFIFAKLDEAGLSPNEEADKQTLIRRATYDLIGLPPSPEEIEAFVNDESPDAWAKLIDRLLDSSHYGEKWARHWMDVIRYAETDGYERDGTKLNMWRYRDYLIRAFNDDKPYDRFVMEHIAGDELADRDADSILATGYQRLQVWDDEPTDREQARADYIADITDTTGSAFLGMSIGCARCHDHKKDPILQDDYFSLYGFFNNITEPQRGNAQAIAKPVRDLPRDDRSAQAIEAWDAKVRALEARIAQAEQDYRNQSGVEFKRTTPIPIVPSSAQQLQPWSFTLTDPGKDWYVQQFSHADWPTATGGFGHAIDRPYFNNDWQTDRLWLRKTFRLTEMPRFLILSITHKDAAAVYINGIQVYHAQRGGGPDHRLIQLPAEALTALVVGSNSLAVSCTNERGDVQFIDVGLYQGVQDPRAALLAGIASQGVQVLGAEAIEQYHQDLAALESLKANPPMTAYPATVIAEHDRTAPEQHIHLRGSVHGKGPTINPGFPEVLGGGDATPVDLPREIQSSGQRLALAQWLVQPDHPLTARVMVNRLWQHHFGKGIVESASEFGVLGTGATHPELLDYLAAEFVESGWSMKEMHRLMMNSRAYRMSSNAQQAGLEKDPINTLLWRFNMRRLTAEEFRDSVLAVNGSLNRKLYGPSVYTPMPAAVLATASRPDQAWGKSSPEQQDRRSIYIFIKRSLREPLLASLDQAETDTPCPVRFTTTVPTQALITINGDFVQQEAEVFAQHLREQRPDDLEQQIALGLRQVFGREPGPERVRENVAFVRQVQADYGLNEQEALRVFGVVCFNLNEFMFID